MRGITLYGSPLSLYTGRARSYLIKAGLPYRETLPTSDHYSKYVLPKMGGRRSVPVIETEQGEVIRDGAAIIDFYEDKSAHSFSPSTTKQRILSRLFDVIGTEGLLRPAMHYRWNFPEENQEFLQFHFECFVPPHLDKKEVAPRNMDRMREAGRGFGAVPETFELVESLYCSLLPLLNAHFGEHPYLLGNRPCIGDFGLIAPLYGHLGRDPKSIALLHAKAIRLLRWVERMNRPEPDIGEFDLQEDSYLGDDHIPETLIAVLKHIAIDFMPETKAACTCINDWIDRQQNLEPDTITERGVGKATFEVEGVEGVDGAKITALAQPYRFYLLKRVQDEYAAMNAQERQSIESLLSSCNMGELLELRLSRDIGRKDNREVWL